MPGVLVLPQYYLGVLSKSFTFSRPQFPLLLVERVRLGQLEGGTLGP